MVFKHTCELCGAPSESWSIEGRDMMTVVRCDACGEFVISQLVRGYIKRDEYQRHRIAIAWRVREAFDSGHRLELTNDNFLELADTPTFPVSRKLTTLLEIVARATEVPGTWVHVDSRSLQARLRCQNEIEVDYLTLALNQRDLVLRNHEEMPGQGDGYGGGPRRWVFQVTPKGWDAMDPAVGGGRPGVCFVAMSFHPSMSPAFDDGIKPAIETDCGLQALRVDRVEHNDPITDRILAGIRSAQVVVADFTLQRQGVYFEAGYALGLGRIVIWTCHKAEEEKLHFDTRQYNHILWDTPADLREKLAARIQATAAVPVKLGGGA